MIENRWCFHLIHTLGSARSATAASYLGLFTSKLPLAQRYKEATIVVTMLALYVICRNCGQGERRTLARIEDKLFCHTHDPSQARRELLTPRAVGFKLMADSCIFHTVADGSLLCSCFKPGGSVKVFGYENSQMLTFLASTTPRERSRRYV